MPIHFTGFDGYYEIYNPSHIVHRKVNSVGEVFFNMDYSSVEQIINIEDKTRILEILYGKNNLAEIK